jgi:hypothetical protein
MTIRLHRYTLLAALLIAFAGLAIFVAPTDPDAWWHLRNGQLVLESGVPHRDVYSWTAEGRPWLMQEWLTEVGMYGVKSAFGYGALSVIFGLLMAAGTALVYVLSRAHGAGRVPALVMVLFFAVFAAPTWGVRPQVLTPVFLGSFFLLLTLYKQEKLSAKGLWALPVIMALWANMHASYFMGIAMLGAFIFGEAANTVIYRPERPARINPLLLTLVGCVLATLINPYFIELWTYPLSYITGGTENPLIRYTQEWQSPNFHDQGNLFFAASLIALALVGIARPAATEEERTRWRWGLRVRIDVTHAILLAAFTILALQAIRLQPVYGLVALPLLAGSLARAWPIFSREGESQPSRTESIINGVVLAVGIILMAFWLLNMPQAQTRAEPRADTGFVYPVRAGEYLAGLNEPVKMYNDFAWGGYLINRLYPQHKVFIDGRADMYREGIFEDHITVQNVAPGWREVLDRHGVDLVLTPPNRPLAYALASEEGWEVAYEDGESVVYRKNE